MGELQSGPTKGEVQLKLQSTHSTDQIVAKSYILPKITSTLPSFSVENRNWAHLDGLNLADPEFFKPAPIDILIGADVYGQLIESEVVKGDPHSPVAQLTRFGWVVFGPTDAATHSTAVSHHVKVETEAIQDLLTKFWVQEEVPQSSTLDSLTKEEAECENHFCLTHSRDSSGRYTVRIPLIDSPSLLGDSRSRAHACLISLLQRFSKSEIFSQRYKEFLAEYEALGHMTRIENTAQSAAHSYYLPHHGVLRENNETTKLRVVFNGSSNTSSGKSLNDIMHTGAKLQRDISDVLLWSRAHKVIFMTDITKMFRQINVHQDDWPLQQILWNDSTGQTITYRLKTVTYGTRAAPFLAVRVLLQLVEDEGYRFPLAVDPLIRGRYVDDICGGAETHEELVKVAQQVKGLCMAGGFPLAKWHSNCLPLLNSISPSDTSLEQKLYEDSTTKILGLSWQPSSDSFTFSSTPLSKSPITKRIILSEVAQLFDPLGFLSPFIIRAKILLQNLWIEKLGWDDLLSPKTSLQWSQFRDELETIKTISIPRWLGIHKNGSLEIHGFSDASQLAMAAVVYLKVTSPEGVSIALVCSKTKVAPLKGLTIPRLELSAAVLLAKLTRYTLDQLKLKNVPVYLWTDSSVSHVWIRSHPSRWKEFVRNRVVIIQETVPRAQWRYVPGKDNPADCASRGLSAAQLKIKTIWWNGPSWLKDTCETWPTLNVNLDSSINLEEKPGVLLTVQVHEINIWDLIHRYSSLNKLLRITALCQRFISRLRRVPNSSLDNPLNPGDLELARLYWAKATQLAHFPVELKTISSGDHLGKAHPMTKLTSFIDHQGILRVGGRLAKAELDPESKHQIIIPKDSRLSQLLIRDAHQRTFHGGTQLTLIHLRRAYWILGGRAPVRSFILKCVQCARQRGLRAQQLMGQLPKVRLTPSRAFLNTGIDYAGPVSLRSWKGRGHKSYKGWLAIFVCMVTSAVHLEVVSDYSTDGFISAYRRFISRRGICRNLYSDCGTNFVGADKALKKLFSAGTKDAHQLAQLMLNDGTQWSFNPPGAPHFGGKWEAAVKSVKFHLARTIGEALLTFEELTTLLNQIEAVLNSRPLEPLSDDPEDLSSLTPGHFLIGEALTTLPEPSLEHLNVGRHSRWELIKQKLQYFWKRWSSSYLQRQQSISKWHHPSHNIKIGSMVLLTDERYPPSKWPLARVTAIHPGSDGLVRVVTIKTALTTLDRPITELALLPLSPPNDD